MATAIRPLRKLQLGFETTKGTAVAATKVLVGEWTLTEEQDFYRSEYPAGYRGTVGGAGTIVRKGTTLTCETELTAEEILVPLSTGILGSVTPAGDGDEKTWTFSPALTTAAPTIESATLEYVESDGSTNQYAGESAYAMTRSFSVSTSFNEVAQLSYEMFARSRQSTTPTASLSPYTGREPLLSNRSKVYLDTAWEDLGTTQLTGVVRSTEFSCTTGIEPDYTIDGRDDADFTKHIPSGLLSATLNLVLELDATGASRWTEYRTNSLVYIRHEFIGSTIDSDPKTITIDGCYRFASPPSVSSDAEVQLVNVDLEAVVDPTAEKIVEFVVVNALAAK